MDWKAKVDLFEQLRREHEFGIGTIAGVAAKFGVHRRVVRRAIASALPRGTRAVLSVSWVMMVLMIKAAVPTSRPVRDRSQTLNRAPDLHPAGGRGGTCLGRRGRTRVCLLDTYSNYYNIFNKNRNLFAINPHIILQLIYFYFIFTMHAQA